MSELNAETDHTLTGDEWDALADAWEDAERASDLRPAVERIITARLAPFEALAARWEQSEDAVCCDSCQAHVDARRYAADDLRDLLVTTPAAEATPEPCTQCEGGESRCLYYACGERQDDRHTRWWCEFGTCSRAHAVLHYGEEAI